MLHFIDENGLFQLTGFGLVVYTILVAFLVLVVRKHYNINRRYKSEFKRLRAENMELKKQIQHFVDLHNSQEQDLKREVYYQQRKKYEKFNGLW